MFIVWFTSRLIIGFKVQHFFCKNAQRTIFPPASVILFIVCKSTVSNVFKKCWFSFVNGLFWWVTSWQMFWLPSNVNIFRNHFENGGSLFFSRSISLLMQKKRCCLEGCRRLYNAKEKILTFLTGWTKKVWFDEWNTTVYQHFERLKKFKWIL